MTSPVCVITGVGPGNGAAFSRKMSAEGYQVAMLARSADRLQSLQKEIRGSRGYSVDISDAEAVSEAFRRVRAELGPVDVLLHNAGSGVFGSFMDTSPEDLEQSWRTNTLGLMLCAKEACRDMLAASQGTIVVTGATASLRGGANFAAFASAKAAQRSLAQSMARSLGPKGVHVAYVVVDGVIDIPRTRALMPDRPDEKFLRPEDIASSVFHLVQQKRSAWTFEIDLRPFTEQW